MVVIKTAGTKEGFYEKRLRFILQVHTKLRNQCAQDFPESPPSTGRDAQPFGDEYPMQHEGCGDEAGAV